MSELTVKQFLIERNEKEGYGTNYECLAETLTEEGKRVYTNPEIDMHRWYGIQEAVNEIDGLFIMFNDYVITGDNGMSDMDLEYDLGGAKFVTKKERTITETYYG